MEVSGVVTRHVPCFFRRDSDSPPSTLSFSYVSVGSGTRELRIPGTSRMRHGLVISRFCDDGHLQYYVGPKCYGKLKKDKEKEKEKRRQKDKVKSKLKLLEGFSGYVSVSSLMGFVLPLDEDLIGELPGDLISVEQTREALIRQLKQLKAEEEELKRKRKVEKAKLKAGRMKTSKLDCYSSESSDNEAYGVIDMNYYATREGVSQLQSQSQGFLEAWAMNNNNKSVENSMSNGMEVEQDRWEKLNIELGMEKRERCSSGSGENAINVEACGSGQRVEVCMGNKCRKAGAAMLMDEIERMVGSDTVCGCKCMGKCRDGPNVRFVKTSSSSSSSSSSSPSAANTLCIGVGLEDVGAIVEAHFSGFGLGP